jgi:hypothetical protein
MTGHGSKEDIRKRIDVKDNITLAKLDTKIEGRKNNRNMTLKKFTLEQREKKTKIIS